MKILKLLVAFVAVVIVVATNFLVFADDGPFDTVRYLHIDKNGMYVYCFKDGEKWYININDNISPAYDAIWNLPLTKNGKYAYCYKDDDKWYVNINGNIYYAGDYAALLEFTESGQFAFVYQYGDVYYVNMNGNVTGPYIIARSLRLTESGYYGHCYQEIESGNFYVNINDSIIGPYKSVMDLLLTENGQYAYSYQDIENEERFANINGIDFEAFNTIYNLRLTESGNYAYCYQNGYYHYLIVNGVVKKGYSNPMDWKLILEENGNFAYVFLGFGNYYNMNINDSVNEVYQNVECLQLTDASKYAYVYRAWHFFLNINGTVINVPFWPENLQATARGKYIYGYGIYDGIDRYKFYVSVNGNTSKAFDDVTGDIIDGYDSLKYLQIMDNGKYAYTYKHNGKWYVYRNSIDGINEPSALSYSKLYPNPTTSNSTITLELAEAAQVNITLCDMLGREIKQIYNAFTDAGNFTQYFSTQEFAKGVYYLRIQIGGEVMVEKVVVN
jgi:hypothetical protein